MRLRPEDGDAKHDERVLVEYRSCMVVSLVLYWRRKEQELAAAAVAGHSRTVAGGSLGTARSLILPNLLL